MSDTATFTVRTTVPPADHPADLAGNELVLNGQRRGLHTAVPRPGTGELTGHGIW